MPKKCNEGRVYNTRAKKCFKKCLPGQKRKPSSNRCVFSKRERAQRVQVKRSGAGEIGKDNKRETIKLPQFNVGPVSLKKPTVMQTPQSSAPPAVLMNSPFSSSPVPNILQEKVDGTKQFLAEFENTDISDFYAREQNQRSALVWDDMQLIKTMLTLDAITDYFPKLPMDALKLTECMLDIIDQHTNQYKKPNNFEKMVIEIEIVKDGFKIKQDNQSVFRYSREVCEYLLTLCKTMGVCG